jgi:hypothetical protein
MNEFPTFFEEERHSIEGMKIRCGKFFGTVKNGKCSECGREVKIGKCP